MPRDFLILCDTDGNQVKRITLEMLSKANALAQGGATNVVVLGDVDTSILKSHGADKIYRVKGADFTANNTGPVLSCLKQLIADTNPNVVLGAATPQGREIFPRLSVRTSSGLGGDVTNLVEVGDDLVGIRPKFEGKVFCTVKINTGTKLFTVRPNSFDIVSSDGAGEEIDVSVEVDGVDGSYKVVGIEQSPATIVDLTEADRIVSGGRSVKSKDSFDALIRPLAVSIGATPGASRAAVDAGFAAHSDQVGQTGKVVNPSLYIACGISGAIQHLAGMRTSRVIVSINKDPNAPIFKHSTYGIVADMFDVCPILTQALSDGSTGSAPVKAAAPKEASVQSEKKVEPKQETQSTSTEASKTESSTAPSTVDVAKTTSSASETTSSAKAPTTAPNAVPTTVGIDPRLFEKLEDELKKQITALQSELKETKSSLKKAIDAVEASNKAQLQRVEKNARVFQEGGMKQYEMLDGKIVAEVRKVRETLRKGIQTDTEDLKNNLTSLRNMMAASIVFGIFSVVLLMILMMMSG